MTTLLLLALQVLAGWLLADFLSGVLHWLEDNYGDAEWPVIGAWVIAPNRLHHLQPLAFTRSSFLARNGTSAIASAILGGLLILAFGPSLLLIVATIGGAMANQVHAWAHLPHRAPRIVRHLQGVGLVQSQRHHNGHHAPPHRGNYCILTDWLNPLLDRVRFWDRLDAAMPERWRA